MRPLALIAATCVFTLAIAGAQAPVAEWTFDGGDPGVVSLDPGAQVATTQDQNVTREGGGGCLEFSYTPAPGTMSAIAVPITGSLAGGKSIHGWFRNTDAALVMVALYEADGSNYNTLFYSIANTWQEVAVDFSEFTLADDSTDENAQLDPGQVQSVMIGDGIAFLAQAAETVPFIMAPELGPRMLWVDDLSVSGEGVEPRWREVEVAGLQGVQVDSFEGTPLQWATLAGAGLEVAYDGEHKSDGDLSLRLQYDLPQGKLFGFLTGLRGVPLEGMAVLRAALMSEMPIMLLVEIKEADESKYNTIVELVAADEFQTLELPLDQLTLADDSTDENGKLDITQAKELLLADVSALAQMPAAPNALWVDDVTFVR